METVIPPEKVKGHDVRKYRFKTLTGEGRETAAEEAVSQGVRPYRFAELEEEPIPETVPTEPPAEESGENAASEGEETPERDGLLEEMIRKADELSGELVKMQMKLEKQEEEFSLRLEEARKEAFEEGVQEGRRSCRQEFEQETASLKERIAEAVEQLAQVRERFEHKIDTIEEELVETALDLARQVVVKEIREESAQVALRLARLLLAEVKEASRITLKLNPADYDFVKERLAPSEKIEIVADKAVAPGGVVILSDIGNIDGQIMERFERIKEAVFGTVK